MSSLKVQFQESETPEEEHFSHPVDGQKDLYRPVSTILFMGTLFYGNEVALRVMIDIEGPLRVSSAFRTLGEFTSAQGRC